MYRIDIGIDLGTSNVRIYMRDKGIVLDQPSVVAYDKKTKDILAVGLKAKKMLGKTPDNMVVERPITQGTISNYLLTERMLKAFVKNALTKKKIWGRPNICISVPGEISEMERRAVEDAVMRTGAKNVFIISTPLAAAIGAGLDIVETYGHLVIDIGGGKTDIAVISSGGISEGKTLKIAGEDYTKALIRYVRRKYSIELGELTAEDAKKEIGTVYPQKTTLYYEVKGKNLLNGLPTKLTLSNEETMEAFSEVTEQIIDTICHVIEKAPPELIADAAKEGIVLTGGGSLIHGMDQLIQEKTGIKTLIYEDAMELTANGTGTAGSYMMVQDQKKESALLQ